MSDKMSDDEVRAELERIEDPGPLVLWDGIIADKEYALEYHALRLLAESQRALGEIAEDEIGGSDSHCPDCIRKCEIARKHWKGGSNG